MSTDPVHAHPRDPDFAEEVLAELYAYRRKRKWLAWLLWATLGYLGAHRFYLERHGTGVLMFLTGGGALIWWLADAFFVGSMLRSDRVEQERREAAGEPPLELSFMPPLRREVLERPPPWTDRWRDAGRGHRVARLVGDVAVLLVSGFLLGAVAGEVGVWEAVLAVVVLVTVTSAGASLGGVGHLPPVRGLIRWSHRVRLFYYHNKPGRPVALLFRSVTGPIMAPFRRRDRAEVRLYLELGGVFTLGFLLLDLGQALVEEGWAVLTFSGLLSLWVEEAAVTFVVIYAFAAPIGAVLTLYLLMRPTHSVPRALGAVTLGAILLGILA